MNNLQIGTYDWQHPNWAGTFYPEDIPKDWWLDYYSNAYRILLLPESVWLSWDDSEMDDVYDSVEGDFTFYFELLEQSSSAKENQLSKIVSVFSQRAGGVIVFSEQQNVLTSYAGMPTTLVSKQMVLSGWQWSCQDYTCSGEPCGVLLDLNTDAKQQTAQLKDFIGSLPADISGAPLIVAGSDIDMDKVYSLKTIGEFMGY